LAESGLIVGRERKGAKSPEAEQKVPNRFPKRSHAVRHVIHVLIVAWVLVAIVTVGVVTIGPAASMLLHWQTAAGT
jgi:hypothetical protein